MIICLLKYFFLFFTIFAFYGCQINETLSVIKESIKIDKNKSDYVVKIEEKPIIEETKNESLLNESINQSKSAKSKEEVIIPIENKDLALIYPKIKKKGLESTENKLDKNLVVGLLLPITGKFSKLGEKLINTVRLFPENNNFNIIFKIYNTNSTSKGARLALRQGLVDNVKYYIGPISSKETYALKQIAKRNKITIFSLSNDKTNESQNIFISGISTASELSCIIENIINKKGKNVGIIHDDGKYGKLVKNNINKLSEENEGISFSFLEKSNLINLDDEIRKFSGYDKGVITLKKEIENVKNLDIEDIDLAYRLEKLEKLETLGEKPFDSLIIAQSGNDLIEILALLAFYDVDASNVNIFGTNIWEGIHLSDEDVLDNTFYASSLSNKKEKYKEKYFELFRSYPNNLNYILTELIDFLIYNAGYLDDLKKIKNTIYNGNFGSIKLSEGGYFEREIFINEFKNGLLRQNFTCSIQNI